MNTLISFWGGLFKMKLITIFNFILLSFSLPVYAEFKDCASVKDTCEYYRCVEAQATCGFRGYPRGFGQKYCLRFQHNQVKFSDQGQLFIERTRNCLINHLDKMDSSVKCSKIKKQSFKDHIPCYIESGFCSLSNHDRKELYKTIWPSLWRAKVLISGIKMIRICNQL